MMLMNRTCLVFVSLAIASAAFAQDKSSDGVPVSPEDGGPRNWEVTGVYRALNLRAKPSTAAKVVALYASGTILMPLSSAAEALESFGSESLRLKRESPTPFRAS
jgi:hypothetical protein